MNLHFQAIKENHLRHPVVGLMTVMAQKWIVYWRFATLPLEFWVNPRTVAIYCLFSFAETQWNVRATWGQRDKASCSKPLPCRTSGGLSRHSKVNSSYSLCYDYNSFPEGKVFFTIVSSQLESAQQSRLMESRSLNEEFTRRLSALERKFQQAIRDKDLLQKQLEVCATMRSHNFDLSY